jgi:D-arabinose 1-dehydrogenase-like Zn-dependent alcohol dehydrogenase
MAAGRVNIAFVSEAAGTAVVEKEVPLKACGPNDVVVEIMCSGLCFSDVAMMTNEWGMSAFPMVCGHEGVGKIVEIGAHVSTRKVGDVVGIGWMRDSCQDCRHCCAAKENLCDSMMPKGVGAFCELNGTFAKYTVGPAKFATPIPSGLDPKAAAPLMCAGITVWNPLVSNANYMSKVGINAVGGLGHLAVKFAAAMGMEVVGMSRGMAKKEKTLSFGAKAYIDTTDKSQMEAHAGSFDLILDTAPVTGDMSVFLPLLRGEGKYVTVGAPGDGKKMEAGNFEVLPKSLSIKGSGYGSISQLSDMMIFCARHNITADYQEMPMSQLKEAVELMQSGKQTALRIVLTR